LPLAWSSLFFSVLFVFGGGIIGWLESDIWWVCIVKHGMKQKP
jgi:hypothetical protein